MTCCFVAPLKVMDPSYFSPDYVCPYGLSINIETYLHEHEIHELLG